MIQFANYISTTLAGSITAGQTTLAVMDTAGMPSVTAGSGNYFYLTLIDQVSAANNTNPPAQREVVKVTDITGQVLTVVRGQDNTVAQAFALGSVAEIRFNAKAAQDLTFLYSNVLAQCGVYTEADEATQYAYDQVRLTDPGAHPTVVRAGVHIQHHPVGSGLNGPTAADQGFQVSAIKQGYPNSAITGEVDAILAVTRNDVGDTAGYQANVQVANGYGAVLEGVTTAIPPGGGVINKDVRFYAATIDTPSGDIYGSVSSIQTGVGQAAFQGQSVTPSSWTYFFRGLDNGVTKYTVANSGLVNVLDPAQGYAINSLKRLGHSGAANVWTALYDGSGVENVRLGGTGDPVNYYGNTEHAWYTRAFATKVAQLDSTGWSLQNGIRLDQVSAANGAIWTRGMVTELITLNTGGLTTDSVADLLPANSIIEAVVGRVVTTITTTSDWAIGDPTTSDRFASPNATLVAGTTFVGLNQFSGAVSTLAAGPTQAAAAKVRITCTGANPGAGSIRVTVFYRTFTPPTS